MESQVEDAKNINNILAQKKLSGDDIIKLAQALYELIDIKELQSHCETKIPEMATNYIGKTRLETHQKIQAIGHLCYRFIDEKRIEILDQKIWDLINSCSEQEKALLILPRIWKYFISKPPKTNSSFMLRLPLKKSFGELKEDLEELNSTNQYPKLTSFEKVDVLNTFTQIENGTAISDIIANLRESIIREQSSPRSRQKTAMFRNRHPFSKNPYDTIDKGIENKKNLLNYLETLTTATR